MKKAIIFGIGVLVIGGGVWLATRSSDDAAGSAQAGKYAEPADAADALYVPWLKAARDASAEPDRMALAKLPVLTGELSAKITAALQAGAKLDPVLCQTAVPQGIVSRNVFETGGKAQILITSKDKSVTKQAVVSLDKAKDTWVISDIQCTDGETAPEREFTFEQEGFLIKTSVPKPFDNKKWHLVFTQGGVPGNVVPLLLDGKSQCTNLSGVKAVCKPEQFTEAAKVVVRGQMTERGATVAELEFVK